MICRNILAGYKKGLADPYPIVLDRDYAWLLELVAVSEEKRAHFWQEIAALKAPKKPAHAHYVKCLTHAMPEPKPRQI